MLIDGDLSYTGKTKPMRKIAVPFISVSITLLLLTLVPTTVLGQGQDQDNDPDAACRAFLNRAYSELGRNCAGLGLNEACYGYGDVESTFYVDGNPLVDATDFGRFVEVGEQSPVIYTDDRAKLENMKGTQFVAPRNPNEDGEWGVAVANLQMNLPRQLDDNYAVMAMLGDTNVESGVLPEDTFIADATVSVTVEDAPVFNKPPGYNTFDEYPSEAIETVSGTFEADAISPDGAWVRIFYTYDRTFVQRATAWLETSTLTNSPDLAELPELGPEGFAALQDIYLQTSLTPPGCDLAPPNGLFIQGPRDYETDLRINEIPIRLNSAAWFDKPAQRLLRVYVFAGVVQIYPGSGREIIVAAGEEAIICLTEPLSRGIDRLPDDQLPDPECDGIDLPVPAGRPGLGTRPSLDLPNNILIYRLLIRVIITRASGIGSPVVDIIITPPPFAEPIRRYCEQGLIPGPICDFLR